MVQQINNQTYLLICESAVVYDDLLYVFAVVGSKASLVDILHKGFDQWGIHAVAVYVNSISFYHMGESG